MHRNHRPFLKIPALPLHTAHIFSPHYSRAHHFGGILMKQEYQNIHQSTSAEEPAGAASGGGGADFQQLMAASPTLSPLAGWLKCLRKPAISVEYSFKKRHVPDLDQDCSASGQGGQASSDKSLNAEESGQTVSASQSPSKSGVSCGQNSDVMGMGGSFTIRYFDFALGILGLAIVKCVTRGCRCIGRKLD